MNAVFSPLNMGLIETSRSRFKQSGNSTLITQFYVWVCFVNFWVILGETFSQGIGKTSRIKKIWRVNVVWCSFIIRIPHPFFKPLKIAFNFMFNPALAPECTSKVIPPSWYKLEGRDYKEPSPVRVFVLSRHRKINSNKVESPLAYSKKWHCFCYDVTWRHVNCLSCWLWHNV